MEFKSIIGIHKLDIIRRLSLVNNNEARQNSCSILHEQVFQSTVLGKRIIALHVITVNSTVADSLDFASDDSTNEHGSGTGFGFGAEFVGPTAAGVGPDPAASWHLETVHDDMADGTWRGVAGGQAEGGGAVGSEGAGDGGGVEAEELVAVRGTTWIFGTVFWEEISRVLRTDFDGVAVVFEAGDRTLGVVDF